MTTAQLITNPTNAEVIAEIQLLAALSDVLRSRPMRPAAKMKVADVPPGEWFLLSERDVSPAMLLLNKSEKKGVAVVVRCAAKPPLNAGGEAVYVPGLFGHDFRRRDMLTLGLTLAVSHCTAAE